MRVAILARTNLTGKVYENLDANRCRGLAVTFEL